jgi:iron only hydrogenase large subunit-like protein
MCHEIQTIRAINTSHRSRNFIISTPYKQDLIEASCVFCGQCVNVCPVGAIHEHDQSAEVQAALNKSKAAKTATPANAITHVITSAIAQISPTLAPIMDKEFALAAGSITAGKMIAAIKLLGFDKVYDAGITAKIGNLKICREFLSRQTKLPLISGCSEGLTLFVRKFFPELSLHLVNNKWSSRNIFASSIKDGYINSLTQKTDISKEVVSVSFVPCLAQKYLMEKNEADFALTPGELAQMIKLAGIKIETLPEESFDTIDFYTANPEEELSKQECPTKKMTVHGFAQARKVMEAIIKGECDADWVEVFSCQDSRCLDNCCR